MPGYDRTGPRGEGPMTGGGFGKCASGKTDSDRLLGQGRGGAPRGGGRGRGFRNAGSTFNQALSKNSGSLENKVNSLQKQLSDMKEMLSSLISGGKED